MLVTPLDPQYNTMYNNVITVALISHSFESERFPPPPNVIPPRWNSGICTLHNADLERHARVEHDDDGGNRAYFGTGAYRGKRKSMLH
jgi:hypothetical protein